MYTQQEEEYIDLTTAFIFIFQNNLLLLFSSFE